MSNKNAIFLARLLREESFEKNIDIKFLESVLASPDFKHQAGDPEQFSALFALERARSRLDSARKRSRRVFGLEALIENIKKVPEEAIIDFYNIEAKGLRGGCHVYERNIIGYEFVVKGKSQSLPGLHPDLI